MSTVLNNYQISGAFPSTVGGVGSTAKYFPAPSGQIGVTGSTPSATSAAGQLLVPGNNRLNAQIFEVYAAGNFEVGSGGACPSVTIDIQANTGTVASPSYHTLATSGAITTQNLDGVFYPWYFKLELEGDSASGLLQGRYVGAVNDVLIASTIIGSTLSGLNFATEPVFGLVARVTFSVSEAGNSANMYQFLISA
jgi:hypothetical protein